MNVCFSGCASRVEPAVTPHWVVLGKHNFACSMCLVRVPNATPYCPYCGARMTLPGKDSGESR